MVHSSPSNIQQQTEHLLHKYKSNDKTLQKAQLKQYKISQNFLTSPAPAAPNTPPLPTVATPKVSPLLEPNESYANFLARLEAAISHTIIREETKKNSLRNYLLMRMQIRNVKELYLQFVRIGLLLII